MALILKCCKNKYPKMLYSKKTIVVRIDFNDKQNISIIKVHQTFIRKKLLEILL